MYSLDDVKPFTVWRHLATDSLYLVMGLSRDSTLVPDEGRLCVVYYSMSYQRLNHRLATEFLDGRFEPEPPKVNKPKPRGE